MNAQVSIVKCASYEPRLVQEAVSEAINLAGGIESFIKPASTVLIKPNLLMAKEPEFGIDTHPEVVRAAVISLKKINCKVLLGDGPSSWGNHAADMDKLYEKTGMKRISEEEGVELLKSDSRRWYGKFPLSGWLDVCDCLLNIPKFKTHDLMILTGAIKNLYGLVSTHYKLELHKRYFHPENFAVILVDIYEKIKPSFTIVDGIVAMEGDGPGTSGALRNLGLVLAGSDCVALDSVLALIMGLSAEDILTNKEAARRRLGVSDINRISILGEKLTEVIKEPFKLPTTYMADKIPPFAIELAKKFLKHYPTVEPASCTRCLACIEACPTKVISMKEKGIAFNYSGCIACFCCQEACPASAIKVKKSLLAKMIGL